MSRFRADTLLGVRDQVRGAAAGARSPSPVSGSSATKTGNSEVANKTDNPRPVRTVVGAISDQVKASADRLDRTVKKPEAGEQKKSDSDSTDEG